MEIIKNILVATSGTLAVAGLNNTKDYIYNSNLTDGLYQLKISENGGGIYSTKFVIIN